LLFKRGRISENLTEEITLWESLEYQAKNLLMVELPFSVSSSVPTMSDLTIEQHQQRRKELARRLGEMNARKREQRVRYLCIYLNFYLDGSVKIEVNL
jgi:actin-related protein 5